MTGQLGGLSLWRIGSCRILCLPTPEKGGRAGCLVLCITRASQDLVFPNARGSGLDAGQHQAMRGSRSFNVALKANASDVLISHNVKMNQEPPCSSKRLNPVVFSGVYGPYTGSYQRESTHSQGNSSGGRAVIASKSTPHACFVGPIPRVIAHTAFPA